MNIQVQNYNLNFGMMKYSKIPKKELKECLQEGKTYQQMSEKFNVSSETILRTMRWYGLKSNRAAESEKNKEIVTRMYLEGQPIKNIKKESGLSGTSINRILKPLREPKRHVDETLEKIMQKLNLKEEDVKKYLK